MTPMRIALLAAALIVLAARPARADNCSPTNRADCEQTAGYNAAVTTISGLAIFGGLVLGGSLLGGDDDNDGGDDDWFDDQKPEDPANPLPPPGS